jgi:hypothetical protein
MTPSPLFIVIEPTGAQAREPAARVAWACEREAGVAEAGVAEAGVAETGVAETGDLARAARRIAALADEHPPFLADPLFDAPRLAALFADAGLGAPPEARDWLLALAPFGQAKSFAAILEAATTRADPDNPATRLLEAWREAAVRAQTKPKKARQPKT